MTAPASQITPLQSSHLRVALMPVLNILNSLSLLNFSDDLTDMAGWVYDTARCLDGTQRENNRLIMAVLLDALIQDTNLNLSFPEFLEQIELSAPQALHERVLLRLAQSLSLPVAELPGDSNAFVATARRRMGRPALSDAELRRAHDILGEPETMQSLLVGHLRGAWERWLAVEWSGVEQELREAVEAFNRQGLDGLDRETAFQWVTGRSYTEELDPEQTPDEIIFVPSAHMGPYLTAYDRGDRVYLCFGSRLPAGQPDGSGMLAYGQLLLWTSALADETRLSILAMIAHEGEVCAQEIINRFALSQSSASRHLRQLRAAGFLRERRRDGANKCYTLNPGRMDELIKGLRALLTKN